MSALRIIGIFLLLVGFAMFGWGVTAFTWSGPGLSSLMSELGKYSFFLWLPTIVIAIALIRTGRRKKN